MLDARFVMQQEKGSFELVLPKGCIYGGNSVLLQFIAEAIPLTLPAPGGQFLRL